MELYLEAANGEEDVLLGQLEASALQRLEVCLIVVLSETGNFPCARHLHPQFNICPQEPGKGELGNLGDRQERGRRTHVPQHPHNGHMYLNTNTMDEHTYLRTHVP